MSTDTSIQCWDCFKPVAKVGKLNEAMQCKSCANKKKIATWLDASKGPTA